MPELSVCLSESDERKAPTRCVLPLTVRQGPGLVNVRWASAKRQVFNWAGTQTSTGSGKRCASSLPAASRRRILQNYTRAIADRKRPAPLLRNPSAPRTWTRHRASSGRERLSSARRRPGASPRSNARRSASWRRWHILLCLQMLRRHCLSRTAPGSRASRSRLRVELVGPSR